MIHKHMYIAYLNKGEAEIKQSDRVVTATVKYFEDKAILYYEGKDEKRSSTIKNEKGVNSSNYNVYGIKLYNTIN